MTLAPNKDCSIHEKGKLLSCLIEDIALHNFSQVCSCILKVANSGAYLARRSKWLKWEAVRNEQGMVGTVVNRKECVTGWGEVATQTGTLWKCSPVLSFWFVKKRNKRPKFFYEFCQFLEISYLFKNLTTLSWKNLSRGCLRVWPYFPTKRPPCQGQQFP